MATRQNLIIGDIFSDPRFDDLIYHIVDANYYKRPSLKEGLRYKRNGFDSLNDQGLLQADKLKDAFQKILNKKGRYSARDRETISWIINRAITQYYQKYVKEDGNQEESGNEGSDKQ